MAVVLRKISIVLALAVCIIAIAIVTVVSIFANLSLPPSFTEDIACVYTSILFNVAAAATGGGGGGGGAAASTYDCRRNVWFAVHHGFMAD